MIATCSDLAAGVDSVRAGRCTDRLHMSTGVDLEEFVAHHDNRRAKQSKSMGNL